MPAHPRSRAPVPVASPPVRVLFSPPYIGGTGGMERALHDMTMALVANGHRVDISAPKVIPGTWGIDPEHFRAVPPWRTRGAAMLGSDARRTLLRAARPVRRSIGVRYDLHLGFRWTRNINALIHAEQHWINPSGNVLGAGEFADYDAVAMQAPGNTMFLADALPTVLLPPPLLPLAGDADPVPGLPAEYLLTVFNSAREAKGGVDLAALVETSPLPVVWCTGAASPGFGVDAGVYSHPRLTVLREPSRAQLRWLYERAYAYVSLSHSEGFGWSIADALRYCPRVVGRQIGVLTFDEAVQRGVHLVPEADGVAGIDWDAVAAGSVNPAERDLEWLSAASFCRRIETLLVTRSGGPAGPR